MEATEPSPPAAARPPRLNWYTILGTTTIGLVALNAALLFTGSGPPPTGFQTFYWQRFNNFLYPLRFWGVIVAPICVGIWGLAFLRRRRRPEAFVALLGAATLTGACLCCNYWAIFVSGFTGPADSLTFNARTYQLVEATQYDDPEHLYLGECDASGLWCVFRDTYVIYWLPPDRSPHLARAVDGSALYVELGDSVVYSFDGLRGHCISQDFGQCVLGSP